MDEHEPQGDLEAGHVLGRYRIEDRLGAGGMGAVYRTWDSTLRRWVALKVVAQGTEFAERLIGEARAAAALRHPNIVSVFDVGTEGGYAFVSMDLIEGRPLRAYVAQRDVPIQQRLTWLLQVASALQAAHQAGLVHRDIKPDNVMVSKEGDIRVLDFGLAKSFAVDVHARTAQIDAAAPSAMLTGEGKVIGTPAYMAPEQLAGAPASPSWDQYAWGITAYELLTGKHPRLSQMISVSGWVSVDSMVGVPPIAAQVVARAMAPSPDQRFPSMEALLAELGGKTSSASVKTFPVNASSAGPSTGMNVQVGETLPVPLNATTPQRQVRWLAPIIGFVALVAIAASVVVWRFTHPPSAVVTTAVPASSPVVQPVVSSAPMPTASAPIVVATASASVTARPAVTTTPAPPKKLSVRMRSNSTLQYDGRMIERMVQPVLPLVQSCVEQHPPKTFPAAIGVTLELWSIGQEVGKVRDVKVTEPAMASCIHDVFIPMSMGPPKSPSMPPGAVFVTIDAERQ